MDSKVSTRISAGGDVRVYKVVDGDWFVARTKDDARREQVRHSGESEYMLNDVRELSGADLERHCVLDEDVSTDEPITFAESLKNMIAKGGKFPCLMASSDPD